jgi:hypothetical protein
VNRIVKENDNEEKVERCDMMAGKKEKIEKKNRKKNDKK